MAHLEQESNKGQNNEAKIRKKKKKSQLTLVKSEEVMLACRECLLSSVGGWDVSLVVIESDKG